MSDEGLDQDEQDEEQQQSTLEALSDSQLEALVEHGLQFRVDIGGGELFRRLDDGELSADSDEIRTFLRENVAGQGEELAVELERRQTIRFEDEQKDREEQVRQDDDALRSQLREEIEAERREAAEKARVETIRAEILAEEAAKAQPGPAPDEEAERALGILQRVADELGNRTLPPETREALWAEAADAEDVLEQSATPASVPFDVAAFEAEWEGI